jgi:hypothetical protein
LLILTNNSFLNLREKLFYPSRDGVEAVVCLTSLSQIEQTTSEQESWIPRGNDERISLLSFHSESRNVPLETKDRFERHRREEREERILRMT